MTSNAVSDAACLLQCERSRSKVKDDDADVQQCVELVQEEDVSNGDDVMSHFLVLPHGDRLRLRDQLSGSHR